MKYIRNKLLRPHNLPYICFYCGEPATDREHVIPKSIVGDNTPIIWSCSECNTIASDNVFLTLEEKRDFIHDGLRKKYKRILKLPNWTQKEILELGYSLRKEVKKVLVTKRWITRRLLWTTSIDALIAMKILQENDIGKDSAHENADLNSLTRKEMRLCFTLGG